MMMLDPYAEYLWYIDYAAVRAGTFKQSISIIVGPFTNDVYDWKMAVSAPYRSQYDRTVKGSIERYETTLAHNDILYSQHDGEETDQYAPKQRHLLTPDEALPIMSDVTRIRELFQPAPVARQRVPVTLWDMLDDEQEDIDE
jgi:hypothetical protein